MGPPPYTVATDADISVKKAILNGYFGDLNFYFTDFRPIFAIAYDFLVLKSQGRQVFSEIQNFCNKRFLAFSGKVRFLSGVKMSPTVEIYLLRYRPNDWYQKTDTETDSKIICKYRPIPIPIPIGIGRWLVFVISINMRVFRVFETTVYSEMLKQHRGVLMCTSRQFLNVQKKFVGKFWFRSEWSPSNKDF